MKLNRVPILNDYPEYRGSFIQSTASNDMAFLDGTGKMFLLNRAVSGAILCLFDELHSIKMDRDDNLSFNKWYCHTKRAKELFVEEKR